MTTLLNVLRAEDFIRSGADAPVLQVFKGTNLWLRELVFSPDVYMSAFIQGTLPPSPAYEDDDNINVRIHYVNEIGNGNFIWNAEVFGTRNKETLDCSFSNFGTVTDEVTSNSDRLWIAEITLENPDLKPDDNFILKLSREANIDTNRGKAYLKLVEITV